MTMPETTQSDLVARLRTTRLLSQRNQMELQCEAAAEITRLRADSERLRKIEYQIDGGRFNEWPTETFVGQLSMQSRDSLDPEYSQFMAATANHMESLRAYCEAMAEALESIADHNKVRDWTSTSDNPETHWVTRDRFYAVIARNALAAYRKENPDVL